jgi:hypothetical protein
MQQDSQHCAILIRERVAVGLLLVSRFMRGPVWEFLAFGYNIRENAVPLLSMTTIQLTPGRRIAVSFFGSIATVYSYFCAMANGIVVGALIGLPSRVADVVAAQRHARYWLYLAVGFQLLTITVVSPLVPPEPSDDSRALRTVFRLGISALLCVLATVLLGTIAFSLLVALRHYSH